MNFNHLKHAVKETLDSPTVKSFLRPLYHTLEDLALGDILENNRQLKNRYRGQRCFVICSGASLRQIDFRLLRNQCTFGTGQLHSPEQDYRVRMGLSSLGGDYRIPAGFSPTFYTALDPVREFVSAPDFITYHVDFWRSANCSFTDPNTVFFLNGADKGFFERHELLVGRRVHYVKTSKPMTEATLLTNDLTKRITFMDGTIFLIFAAAIYMGFTEMFLCGSGYTYHPRQSGHYYESWTRMDEVPVDDRHRLMREFAEAHGVRIHNIVPDGFESPVYEKVAWHEVAQALRHMAMPDAQAIAAGELHR